MVPWSYNYYVILPCTSTHFFRALCHARTQQQQFNLSQLTENIACYILCQFGFIHKMVNEYEIRDFETVLNPYLPSKQKIASYHTKCLTKPGDNYGSLLLAVEVVLMDGEVINLVAKMCPPNEWIKKMFNVPVTFKKEANVYKVIAKTLQEFQLESGVNCTTDFFARYYGSRISLNPSSEEVDDDAVLLLENLKIQGYSIGDRFDGFDLKTTEAIVVALANLHSVTVALKIKNPQIFQENIRLHLPPMKGFSDISDEIKEGMKNNLLKILEKNDEITPYLTTIKDYLNRGEKAFEENTTAREPFATVCHNDFWVNNIMIKTINDQTKIKILDFQIVDYGSPARDLIFFLYSSVQRDVIDKHSANFIQLYYKTFINTLERFKCDVTPFSFQVFNDELKYEAKASQLFHCLVMLSPIYAVRGAVKEVKDLSPSDMLSTDRHENYEPKVIHTVLSFIKHQWL